MRILPLYRANGGEKLYEIVGSSGHLKSFEDVNLGVGLPEREELEALAKLLNQSFVRDLDKKLMDPDSFFGMGGVRNAFITQDHVRDLVAGVTARNEVGTQFPSLARQQKIDSVTSLVLRAIDREGRTNGEIVGYIELSILENDGRLDATTDADVVEFEEGVSREPYLANLAIGEKYRRSGLGTALLQVAEDVVANSWRDPKVYIHIDQDEAARKFWEKNGYQPVSPTKDGITHMYKELEVPPEEPEDESYLEDLGLDDLASLPGSSTAGRLPSPEAV